MPLVGLITEYNPFHNGHVQQLKDVRDRFGKGCLTVAVMSGNFTQRGEPAILDKWTRAGTALECGVNLILELPTLFSIGAAPDFAAGAVRLLSATGLAPIVCCGAETDRPDLLPAFARQSAEEPAALSRALQAALKEGLNPAAAWSRAWQVYGAASGQTWPEDFFSGSNNRLAAEYIKAADALESPLKVHLLKRQEAPYLSRDLSASADLAPARRLASATAIRRGLKVALQAASLPDPDFWSFLPTESAGTLLAHLTSAESHRRDPCALAGQMLYSRLIGLTAADLLLYDGFSAGLAGRLLKVATGLNRTPPDRLWDDLVAATRCKSFTEAMVGRALAALLLGVKKQARASARRTGPLYLRPLAADRRGRRLLRQMRQTAHLPIITKNSDFLEHAAAGPDFRLQYEIDLRAARLYHLLSGEPPTGDFDMNTIIG